MEDLSLNDGPENENSLQIATTDDNLELSMSQHVSDDILEDFEAPPIKRRYTEARELRAVSQNQVIDEPSQGVRTRSSFRLESNIALISEI